MSRYLGAIGQLREPSPDTSPGSVRPKRTGLKGLDVDAKSFQELTAGELVVSIKPVARLTQEAA